jgi:hypothetical protein
VPVVGPVHHDQDGGVDERRDPEDRDRPPQRCLNVHGPTLLRPVRPVHGATRP